jgi:uncharacterized membrane protein HdeD (DUF308 family)
MSMLEKTGTMWIVRGVASVAFGILAAVWPGASIAALVLLYGVYALVDGAFLLGFAFRQPGSKARYIIFGLISIGAGVITFMYPGLTALSLYVLIGAWAISSGIAELAIAVAMRGAETSVAGLVLAGVLSILCGIALFALPLAGILALIGLVVAYAIVNGIVLISAGVRLRHERPLSAM